jgi:hypothetical protein
MGSDLPHGVDPGFPRVNHKSASFKIEKRDNCGPIKGTLTAR